MSRKPPSRSLVASPLRGILAQALACPCSQAVGWLQSRRKRCPGDISVSLR